MKFYEFNETEKKVDIFNERWYKHPENGKFYRNVTTILGIIDKGYAFDEWLKDTGHNSEIIIDRAGNFGIQFHDLVMRFLTGDTVGYYDNKIMGDRASTELWERFNLWFEFWKELNLGFKVEYTNEDVEFITYEEEHEYAGTIDFKAKLSGEPVIFDWKTGNYVGNQEKLQLIAYMKTLGIKKGFIIHVPSKKPNKKGYKIIEVNYTDEMFGLFLATKSVFDMQNTDKPKVLTLPLELSLKDFNLNKEK